VKTHGTSPPSSAGARRRHRVIRRLAISQPPILHLRQLESSMSRSTRKRRSARPRFGSGGVGRSPQRRRSSACKSSPRHGVPASPGASSRLPRLWRPSRLTCSSTTGWGPTTGERSASPTTSGSAPPTTAAHHAPPTPNRVRRLPWCSRWSPTPPWRRTRPAGNQPPAKAPQLRPGRTAPSGPGKSCVAAPGRPRDRVRDEWSCLTAHPRAATGQTQH
jgi:hypothetical protein